jgi:hypothetical protein
MEDVLEVYHRRYDPRRPQVCMDETSKTLHAHAREPLPLEPGKPAREDYEYIRQGTANLFLWFEPLAGRREVKATERRTRRDWAELIRELVDEHYPEAEKIVLVMDNLNTHTLGSLYEAFPPDEARRLAEKLEIHYTPKHGSWLNMAEIELSVLARQCLAQRVPSRAELAREVTAWAAERNACGAKMEWRFTTADARIKLKHPQSVFALRSQPEKSASDPSRCNAKSAWRLAPPTRAPRRSIPIPAASSRTASRRSAPTKRTRESSHFVRFALRRSAPVRLAESRRAPVRSAPARQTPVRSCLLNSAPASGAPESTAPRRLSPSTRSSTVRGTLHAFSISITAWLLDVDLPLVEQRHRIRLGVQAGTAPTVGGQRPGD